MPHCLAFGCSKCSGKGEAHRAVTFHRFPKDPELVKRWLINLGTDVGNINTFCRNVIADKKADKYRLCSNHFTSDCYVDDLQAKLLGTKPKLVLKDSAVPTVFVHRETITENARRSQLINRLDRQRVSKFCLFIYTISLNLFRIKYNELQVIFVFYCISIQSIFFNSTVVQTRHTVLQ